MVIKRKIPSPNNSLLFFMKDPTNHKEYEKAMVDLEKKIEKSLIEIFDNIEVRSTVKSDRYSLPYTDEVIHTGFGESYLNGAFESAPFKRKLLSRILGENVYKIRFYVFAEIEDQFPMGKVNYYFRYYKH